MLESIHLYTRLFVLVCAAVMSFIMCSDAAGASSIIRKADLEVKHKVFRQLYTPNTQQQQLFTAIPSTETGLQSGPSSRTVTHWNHWEPSSIINHQSKPWRFQGGSFGYNQNSPDNRHTHTGMTRVQSGPQPGNNISTRGNLHENFERFQPRVNYYPTTRSFHNSYPPIIRKSHHKEASSPLQQNSSSSQVWRPNVAWKSNYQEKPRDDLLNKVEDTTPFSLQTHRYSSTLYPAQRRHYSSNTETNGLTDAGAASTSRAIQSRKYPSFVRQTAPHAPSISNSQDAYVTEINPSPRPLRSSINDFSLGWQAERSSETPRRKNVHSYLFKDTTASLSGHQSLNTGSIEGPGLFTTTSQTQKPLGAQVYGRFSSHFQGQTKGIRKPSESVSPLHQTAHVTQRDKSTQSYRTVAGNPPQTLPHPVQGTDDSMERFVPNLYRDSQDNNYANMKGKPALSSLANPTASGSMQPQKPEQTNKSIYSFRGFQNPAWRALKKPSVLSSGGLNDSTNSQRYSSYKGKFETVNVPPRLSRKYSFGRRQLTTKMKPERQQTDDSSPSQRTFDVTQILSTPKPILLGFKEVQPQKPVSDAGFGSQTDGRKYRIFRRIYGLKGFSNQPLEGAKASPSRPEESTKVQQDLEGFKLRSSRIWQPGGSTLEIYRVNKANETEKESKLDLNEAETSFKTPGSSKSDRKFIPGSYKKNRGIYNLPGFQRNKPVDATNKTNWTNKEQLLSQGLSSAFLRPTGPLKVRSYLNPGQRESNKTNPVEIKARLFNSFTSSTVRGKRVKGKQANTKSLSESTSITNTAGNAAIVRLPKQPKKAVKTVTYSDILGSASFSNVRATTQTPVTSADKNNDRNITATTKPEAETAHWSLKSEDAVFGRENSSRVPEGQAGDRVKDISGVQENETDQISKGLKTPDSTQDFEGSGSGDFNLFDVFSVKNTGLSDMLELDYLRISAGNVSFKSMNISNNEIHKKLVK